MNEQQNISPLWARNGPGLNMDDCHIKKRGRCACGACAICGFQKHTGIHSACQDGKVYGHEFVGAVSRGEKP